MTHIFFLFISLPCGYDNNRVIVRVSVRVRVRVSIRVRVSVRVGVSGREGPLK